MNDLCSSGRPSPAAVAPRTDAVARLARCLAAMAALAVFGADAVAADLRRPGIPDAPPVARQPAAARVEHPAWPVGRDVLLAPRSSLSIFGRDCLPGFAPDEGGACLRHDDPKLSCGPAARKAGCAVLPPDPAPYGIGAALRLDY